MVLGSSGVYPFIWFGFGFGFGFAGGAGDDWTGSAGTAAAGRVHRGASQADREGVIEALKAAFVVGRLTEGELEVRAGQAFAAPSQADLAAITADIPVGPVAARPARMPDRVVAGGTGVIIAAAALGGAVLVGGPALILWAITMAGVLLFTVSLLLAVRQERRTRGRRPPRAALAGHRAGAGRSAPRRRGLRPRLLRLA